VGFPLSTLVISKPEFALHLRKAIDGELQIFLRMRGRNLRPDTSSALRNDRIKKTDDVQAKLKQSVRDFLRQRGVPDHDWNDRMRSRADRQTMPNEALSIELCILLEFVAQFG